MPGQFCLTVKRHDVSYRMLMPQYINSSITGIAVLPLIALCAVKLSNHFNIPPPFSKKNRGDVYHLLLKSHCALTVRVIVSMYTPLGRLSAAFLLIEILNFILLSLPGFSSALGQSPYQYQRLSFTPGENGT